MLEPRVAAESYGVLLRAPSGVWQDALDLALRCARTPSRDAADFASAAVRLQAKFASDTGELKLRARVAAQIAPRAPGMIAPWGDPGRIGNITARELASAFRESEVGARWSVALVGEVPVDEASARIARRVSDLAAGALPKVAEPGQFPPAQFVPPPSEAVDTRTLLATWDVRGAFSHRLGAAVFASAMHAMLSLTPGVEVTWQDADVYPAGAYATLQLRVAAEVVPRIAALLAETATRVADPSVDEAVAKGAALASRAQSEAEGEASVRAEQLARSRLGAKQAPVARDQALSLVQAFRKVSPRIILIR
jgi:hypothetical protein